MIPSLGYEKALDDMGVSKYSPIRLPAELEEATYGPRGPTLPMTPSVIPVLLSSIAGT